MLEARTELADDALVLASASAARARLLRSAGLRVEIDPAAIDEAAVRASLGMEKATGREIAEILAALKAVRVSSRHGGCFVLGADQTLTCGGQVFVKPEDRETAWAQLRTLSGERHELVSALAIARGGEVIWRCTETATLTMRVLSDGFIERYLDAAGSSVTESVGAYAIEGLGIQLFAAIDGHHDTILGLPLLPLLTFLRAHRIVPT